MLSPLRGPLGEGAGVQKSSFGARSGQLDGLSTGRLTLWIGPRLAYLTSQVNLPGTAKLSSEQAFRTRAPHQLVGPRLSGRKQRRLAKGVGRKTGCRGPRWALSNRCCRLGMDGGGRHTIAVRRWNPPCTASPTAGLWARSGPRPRSVGSAGSPARLLGDQRLVLFHRPWVQRRTQGQTVPSEPRNHNQRSRQNGNKA